MFKVCGIIEISKIEFESTHQLLWAAEVFITKPFTIDFVYFYRKIPNKNPLHNKEVSSQSAEKEFLLLIKRKTVI